MSFFSSFPLIPYDSIGNYNFSTSEARSSAYAIEHITSNIRMELHYLVHFLIIILQQLMRMEMKYGIQAMIILSFIIQIIMVSFLDASMIILCRIIFLGLSFH